jgi:hypothetical protein
MQLQQRSAGARGIAAGVEIVIFAWQCSPEHKQQ